MSPTGWAGDFHSKDRFLFRDLSEWVIVSASWKQAIALEWRGTKQKCQLLDDQTLFEPKVEIPWNHNCSSRSLQQKTPIQGEHSWCGSVWWFYMVMFKTKSLRPAPRKYTIHSGGKNVEVLFHTQNKLHLDQSRIKIKYKNKNKTKPRKNTVFKKIL